MSKCCDELTDRQTAVILGALHMVQDVCEQNLLQWCRQYDDVVAIWGVDPTAEEIDEICDTINS